MSFSVCVYCGSRKPLNTNLSKLAEKTGQTIAEKNWKLVYGGGKVGMMGIVADAVLQSNGEVIGIIPTALKKAEVAHTGVTELIETPDMHSRKALMEQKSDVFLVLPGGFGTLDEFFEILTWRQLGFHNKPIILINQDGYFDGLILYMENAIRENFIRDENRSLFFITENFDDTFKILKSIDEAS